MKQYCKILTIAGSDSGGCAGIQADIKAISACGCFAASAITAITAQNTLGVAAVQQVQPDIVKAQIIAVLDDIGADAVKSGMLFSSDVIAAVAESLSNRRLRYVLDPVMVATSGDLLLQNDAVSSMTSMLFPLAEVITPNIPEALHLLESKEQIGTKEQMADAAASLSKKFSVSVLLKGGHLTDDKSVDVLYSAATGGVDFFESPRINTPNTHGTGCTLSAALAAFAGKGLPLKDAVAQAKAYLGKAIASGAEYKTGEGHGPVNHFF